MDDGLIGKVANIRSHVRADGKGALVKTSVGNAVYPSGHYPFREFTLARFCLCGRKHFFKMLSHVVQVECVCNRGQFYSWPFIFVIF